MDAFTQLYEAISPPSKPREAGNVAAFTAVETSLALLLPEDYKRLIGTYGTGVWKEFLWVLNPFASNVYLNLFEQVKRQLDAERKIRADWPGNVPFALYPEQGGLLPWAMTDNGNRLYWQTVGDPAHWPTVIYESRGPEFECFPFGCCEFLLRWVSGKLPVSVFPRDFDFGFPFAFEPYTEVCDWDPAKSKF